MDKITFDIIKLPVPMTLADRSKTTIFIGNVFITYLEDGTLVSFILEDKETLKFSKMLSEKETLKLFKNKKKYGLTDYEIDDKKRIFYKGDLLNTDFKTMYGYWDEMHKKNNEKQPRNVPGILPFEKLSGSTIPYIGKDSNNNTYFGNSRGVIIYDINGWVLYFFKFTEQALVSPTINSNGDVFYLLREGTIDKPIINLYKIERKW